ncbi:MAG: hypothetical protein ACD_39C01859G0002 [uncultured bacterium]|nr:MAG: hypothetical protein ACD_39C01859G0002 [uncultured bacterium]
MRRWVYVERFPNKVDAIVARVMLALVILMVFVAPVLWNAGSIELSDVNANYIVVVYPQKAGEQFRKVDNFYAIKLKELIESSARPSYNPITILYQHLWYNAVTTGYDLEFWINPANLHGGTHYGLYLSGNTLFLRLEFDGWNRVLKVPFTKAEIETLLQSLPAEVAP